MLEHVIHWSCSPVATAAVAPARSRDPGASAASQGLGSQPKRNRLAGVTTRHAGGATLRTAVRSGVRTIVRDGDDPRPKSRRHTSGTHGTARAVWSGMLTLRPTLRSGAWQRRELRPAPPTWLVLSARRAELAGLTARGQLVHASVNAANLRLRAEGIVYDAAAAERQAAELGGAWIVDPAGAARWSAPARDVELDALVIADERRWSAERAQRRIGDVVARPGARRG